MTIPELREQIIRQHGFTSWFGSPKAWNDLTTEEQLRVNFLMQRYVADNPSQFDEATAAKARNFAATNTNPPLADTSASAAVSEFGSAFADEAVKVTKIGGSTLQNVLYIAALVGAVWLFFFKLKK